MDDRLHSVAVFGGGLVGLSAATAFARALPGVRIDLIATPPDPAALADRMPGTLPAIRAFHARIGFAEADLVRRAGAIHRLGIRFDDWSASGAPWVHAYGDHGPAGVAGFHQHWLAAGDPTPITAHHVGAALAAAGRFAPPELGVALPYARFDHAFTLDVAGYRAGLTALARHLGVGLVEGRVSAIERREDGAAATVALDDGRRIEADLFLDCTGPTAALLSQMDAAFEEWADALPCDRLLLATAGAPALSLVDTVRALPCGWAWRTPGGGASSAGLAYAAAITPTDEAGRTVTRATGAFPDETVAIRPGRRRESWIANVIAFGDAAIALDPLESTNLYLAHSAILRALDLLAGRGCPPPVVAEYNRRTADETGRARDFLALHYCRSGRREGTLWRRAAKAPPAETLAQTLALFEARGRLPHFEEESFDSDDWLAVLLGMGVVPAQVDPMALTMAAGERRTLLRRSTDAVAAAVAAAPPYRDVLGAILQPR